MSLFDYGNARHTDPETSKAAAKSINATKLEQLVLDVLSQHGPLTPEEVTKALDRPIDSITPRFRPLLDKNMIVELRGADGECVTRPGSSGRQRQVYALQSDHALWCERPVKKSKDKLRIEKLETALREIRDVARCSEGVEFYAMLAEQGLRDD